MEIEKTAEIITRIALGQKFTLVLLILTDKKVSQKEINRFQAQVSALISKLVNNSSSFVKRLKKETPLPEDENCRTILDCKEFQSTQIDLIDKFKELLQNFVEDHEKYRIEFLSEFIVDMIIYQIHVHTLLSSPKKIPSMVNSIKDKFLENFKEILKSDELADDEKNILNIVEEKLKKLLGF